MTRCSRIVNRHARAWPVRRRLTLEAFDDRRLFAALLLDRPLADAFSAADASGSLAALTGSIVDGGTVYPLSIAPRSENLGTPIDPQRTTWLVIHGRLGAAAQPIYQDVAAAIDGYSPDDQVLLLDWETAATGWWDGESRIRPVGRWAAAALDDYGFAAGSLNLVGYSWGTYVADELAEELGARQSQVVNSQILLDPATDIPFNSYNPNDAATVNFAAHSRYSWAFHSGGFEGSATSPKTAHEAFVLQGSDHYQIRDQFIRLLDTNQGGVVQNAWFSLGRVANQGVPSAPWLPGAVDDSGGLTVNANGGYEAVIAMDAAGLAEWLTYEPLAGPPDRLRTEPFWTPIPPAAVDDLFQVDMGDWTGSLQRDAATGVLANDTGVSLAAAAQSGPDQGDLVLNSDGSFIYTPWQPVTPFGFRDSFTYQVTDSSGQTDVATVTLVGLPNLQNPSQRTDVNGDGQTTPLDVLLVINALNQFGVQPVAELAQRAGVPAWYYDVTGDDIVSAADVLVVIDFLNASPAGQAEGESGAWWVPLASPTRLRFGRV